MSPKGRVAESIPKVEFATPAMVVDLPRLDPLVSGGNNGNRTALQMPVWVATNPYAAQIGAEVVKQDMESVRAGLLYGLDETEIQAFLTGRHSQSEHARFYAHGIGGLNSRADQE